MENGFPLFLSNNSMPSGSLLACFLCDGVITDVFQAEISCSTTFWKQCCREDYFVFAHSFRDLIPELPQCNRVQIAVQIVTAKRSNCLLLKICIRMQITFLEVSTLI